MLYLNNKRVKFMYNNYYLHYQIYSNTICKKAYVITINNVSSFLKICTKLMSYVTLIIFASGNASWILWALHFIYCSSFPPMFICIHFCTRNTKKDEFCNLQMKTFEKRKLNKNFFIVNKSPCCS